MQTPHKIMYITSRESQTRPQWEYDNGELFPKKEKYGSTKLSNRDHIIIFCLGATTTRKNQK